MNLNNVEFSSRIQVSPINSSLFFGFLGHIFLALKAKSFWVLSNKPKNLSGEFTESNNEITNCYSKKFAQLAQATLSLNILTNTRRFVRNLQIVR